MFVPQFPTRHHGYFHAIVLLFQVRMDPGTTTTTTTRCDAMQRVINRPRVVSLRHLHVALEPSLFEHTRLTPPYDASRDF